MLGELLMFILEDTIFFYLQTFSKQHEYLFMVGKYHIHVDRNRLKIGM